MIPVAPGVWQFRFLWRNAINAYYIEGDNEALVVDASTRWDWGPMRRQLEGKLLTGLVLTHPHPDHQGCAAKICSRWNVPLIVHELDAESAEGKSRLVRQNVLWELIGNLVWAGPRCAVGRKLHAGDRIAGFTVHHMPGHTRGHIVLFREADGVAIVGDVVNCNHPILQGLPYLREPPWWFSANAAENRESIRKLWQLGPKLICAGHGPVLRDMGKLGQFVGRLK